MPHPASTRRAITLLQTLIAIAVIGTLLALFVAGIQKVRAAAAQAQCANQLKQIGLACHSAHDSHQRMPPAFGFYPDSNIYSGASGLGNVFFHLLPYLDRQAL
jgi:type II secretory pathway pseudopilin PulG